MPEEFEILVNVIDEFVVQVVDDVDDRIEVTIFEDAGNSAVDGEVTVIVEDTDDDITVLATASQGLQGPPGYFGAEFAHVLVEDDLAYETDPGVLAIPIPAELQPQAARSILYFMDGIQQTQGRGLVVSDNKTRLLIYLPLDVSEREMFLTDGLVYSMWWTT